MFTKLLSLFKKPVQKQNTHIVLYDADQVSTKILKRIHAKVDHTKTKSVYVWANPTHRPPSLSNLTCVKASSIAKESVDVMITILATKEIVSNTDLKEVHVVSSDADTVGMCVNLGTAFPQMKFFVYMMSNMPKARRLPKTYPGNVTVSTIKV